MLMLLAVSFTFGERIVMKSYYYMPLYDLYFERGEKRK